MLCVVCQPECKVKDRATGTSSKMESILFLSSVVCFGAVGIFNSKCVQLVRSQDFTNGLILSTMETSKHIISSMQLHPCIQLQKCQLQKCVQCLYGHREKEDGDGPSVP